jgi:hypothetical protein
MFLIKFVSMSLANKIFEYNPSDHLIKNVRSLFLLWILTLPFGSNLFNYSIGFMTLYPNLILTFLLFPFTLLGKKKWDFFEYIIIAFLFFWSIYEIIIANRIGLSNEAIFDIRSLLLQFFFALTLIGVFKFIGKQSFLNTLITGLRCFLFILLLSGVIEFITGIHFAGYKTHELLNLPVGNIFYAPMFIYDNPNDYLTYLIFIFLMLNLFDEKLRNHFFLKIIIALVIFFFSVYADSNFAKIISAGILIFCSFEIIRTYFQWVFLKVALPYLAVTFFLIITVVSNPIFLGPKYKNGAKYRLNGISIIEEKNNQLKVLTAKESLSISKQKKVIQYLDSVNTKSPDGSSNLRKNLILNGIDFIKSAPVFGIGPGGFAFKLKHNKQKYYVHTHTSPHNFPIEIISQFGVFGWFYFCALLYILFRLTLLRKKLKRNYKIALSFLFLSIPLLWMMPSSYLYLNIHWLFLPLLVIQLNIIKENSNLDVI